MTGQQSLAGDQAAAGTVLIVCPGGLEHGGGIGRQMGYFLEQRAGNADRVAYRVVDSRGPWFLGASPLHAGFSAFYLVSAILKLLATRATGTPSLAHINVTGRGSTVRKAVLVTAARMIGAQYLLHVHDYDYAAEYHSRGGFMRSVIATMFRRAARVLVLGAHDQNALSELLGLPLDQVTVLHNAVPDPLGDGAKPRRTDGPCHFLFLGRLSERKGVPELLRALATPALKSREWRATLAGGGPVEEFRELATALDIAVRIEFPGWVDIARVKSLCQEADVLVLPSHAEGLAMSILEGLSYGLAVVATPVGAHLEVIEPEVSGILAPPGDAEALAAALARLIDDESLRQRLGAGARQRFLEKFDVRAYADRLGRIHSDLLCAPEALEADGEQPASPDLGGCRVKRSGPEL